MKQAHRFPNTLLGVALGAALFAVAVPSAQAQCYGHSCYYGPSYYYGPAYSDTIQYSIYKDWTYSPQIQGYYCQFSHKPYASYNGYLNHYCVYYPNLYAGKAYYFDPVAKSYYGCYDYNAKGFCLLKIADRKSTIAAIPADAFGKPGALPKVTDLAPANGNGNPLLDAPAGTTAPQIQAPPALPQTENKLSTAENGIVTPPQVKGSDLPPGTDPMSNPTPPIGQ
jgi:hypothetical protein